MSKTFDANKAFNENLDELKRLTQEEYSIDLDELILDLPSEKMARMRLARLLGLRFKEPFGISNEISPSNSDTHAHHAWYWDDAKFKTERADEKWQYQLLKALYMEEHKGEFSEINFLDFANNNAGERNVAAYLLRSTKKYVCANNDTRNEIGKIVNGANIKGITNPQGLISNVGGTVTAAIIASAPIGSAFAAAFAPVAGVIAIYILTIGLDAFCSWAEDYIHRVTETT